MKQSLSWLLVVGVILCLIWTTRYEWIPFATSSGGSNDYSGDVAWGMYRVNRWTGEVKLVFKTIWLEVKSQSTPGLP